MTSKLHKKSTVLWAVLLIAAFCIGGAIFGAYKYRLSSLTLRTDHGVRVLEMAQEPTEYEREVGEKAVEKFKTALDYEKYDLAYDIVRGKALYGKSTNEIMLILGNPDDTGTVMKYLFRYNCPLRGAPKSQLVFGFRNGDVYNSCLLPNED